MIVTMKKAAVSLRAKRMGRSPGPIQDSPQVEHLSVQCNVCKLGFMLVRREK